ncbi:MAG: hypothetical protein M1816_002271 [Peltula sp. TS41687]|nr:MAG: hypothetical protein M1816_002271 [Peltula sp. TS41687]
MKSQGEKSYPHFEKGLQYQSRDGTTTRCNTVDVYLPRDPGQDKSHRIWIVYIHGGGWRDPLIQSDSFEPALHTLLKSPPQLESIAGFASINYRMSPYPQHPTDPSSNDDQGRNVRFPDHLHDVLDALAFLQDKYGFGDQYVLAGHSAGATLAYQVVMDCWRHGPYPALPLAVAGLAGVYDFTAIVARHPGVPMYTEIVENAFGPKQNWDHAAPAVWLGKVGSLNETWPNGRLAVIAYSEEDELVEPEESVALWEVLTGSRNASDLRRVELVKSRGPHDAQWEQGTELASLILKAVDMLATKLT